MKRVLLALLSAFVAFLSPLRAEEALKVSVFSTILTEIAGRVGGDAVQVTGHVPIGADPHDFEPRPGDLKKVAAADLVLLSAKHMEGYVGKLKEATGGKVQVLEVGDQLPTLWMKDTCHAHGPGHKHSEGEKVEDPHWWHSVESTQKAVRVVRDAFQKMRPGQKDLFAKNAEAYSAELGAVLKWAKTKVAELPRNKRKLVTSHDALQYFAKEHGFTVYPVSGLTSAEQPSSKQIAELLKTIREQRVKAVFAEDTANPKVLTQITSETGAVLGGQLWVDGLGSGSASTYEGMLRHNVTTIVDALK
jgi:ABC-type Zn uptake system ZnuABC Zn-binding protein ZnuA